MHFPPFIFLSNPIPPLRIFWRVKGKRIIVLLRLNYWDRRGEKVIYASTPFLQIKFTSPFQISSNGPLRVNFFAASKMGPHGFPNAKRGIIAIEICI